MGTRGLFGFYWGGHFYVVYNHCDSYPGELGVNIVNEVLQADLDQWRLAMVGLKCVDESKPPTVKDIQNLRGSTDLRVSNQSVRDWYCLLRGCQGSLNAVLNAGHLINYTDDSGRPAFQDYAYIINFDTDKFDFYDGDQLQSSTDLNKVKLEELRAKFSS
jgi:hypothetical protein